MPIAAQLRRGIARLISIDPDIGTIERPVYEDNGRGSLVATGAYKSAPPVTCRVSYEGGGVWHRGEWVGGLATDATPYVLAEAGADIRAQDILTWRGKRYTVGAVTHPYIGGGPVCLQAPLVEVK